jgi:hypothetical protein
MKIPKDVEVAVVEELQQAKKHSNDKKSYTNRRRFSISSDEEYVVHRSHFKKIGGCVVVEFKGKRGNKVLNRWNIKPTKS